MLIRDVYLGGRLVSLQVVGDRVAAIAADLRPGAGEEVLDGRKAVAIPGLHDHHVHLLALAAAQRSVRAGPPHVRDHPELRAALAGGDAALPAGAWLRAVGYHESVAGPLDRHALDRLVPARPARVQHRSGVLWMLNSAGLAAVGAEDLEADGVERDEHGRPTGRLFGLDTWLRSRIGVDAPDVGGVSRLLSSFGVTGVTDATASLDDEAVALLSRSAEGGELVQNVTVMGPPELRVPPPLALGPAKIVVGDHDLPSLAGLVDAIRAARARQRTVAFHCVSRVALVLVLAALGETGSVVGDRIEHGGVVPPDLRSQVALYDLTVVTQPHFVAERGDRYLAEVDDEDLPYLYPCASLLRDGIRVGGGTDAPFGQPDPWKSMLAATTRRTDAGAVVNPDECIPASRALDLFLTPPSSPGGEPRRIGVGGPADLCLVVTSPEIGGSLPVSEDVVLTLQGGRVTFTR